MASAAAEEKSESTGSAASSSSGSSGGGNKLVLILTLVNTVVTLAIIAILLVSFKQQKSPPTIADVKTTDDAKAKVEKKGEGEGESKAEGKGEGKGEEHGKTEAKKPAEFGKMVTLDQFTVNLSTPGSSASKFVRVNVSLEVANDDTEAEVNAKMPQIRNVIIDLFNSKRVSDLQTADGRDYLREEIKNALNGFLVHGKVKGVYFTNFMLAS